MKEASGRRLGTQQAIVGHGHYLIGFGATAKWFACQMPVEVSVEQNAKFAESLAKGMPRGETYTSEIFY